MILRREAQSGILPESGTCGSRSPSFKQLEDHQLKRNYMSNMLEPLIKSPAFEGWARRGPSQSTEILLNHLEYVNTLSELNVERH
jgi:hypothetical protein